MNVNHSELIEAEKVKGYYIRYDILWFGYTMTSLCTITGNKLKEVKLKFNKV